MGALSVRVHLGWDKSVVCIPSLCSLLTHLCLPSLKSRLLSRYAQHLYPLIQGGLSRWNPISVCGTLSSHSTTSCHYSFYVLHIVYVCVKVEGVCEGWRVCVKGGGMCEGWRVCVKGGGYV